ncbi:8-oxo-dGDP phosphatase NUDT18-like [Tubulanus polymorphus]|uniref:8-oxo-dGDP phosphatase NUDT18-like n=1 Tax=Tubulanus polymorphus TaxID=672921 RepID=UPI003DA4372D
MEGLELELSFLLEGKSVAVVGEYDTKRPNLRDDFVPLIKRTVCYIVCGVIFNEAGEVLMMQEAKASCYGKWYLPAGRMEPDETIVEAVKREVLEETGLEFEPDTLLAIQISTGIWYRYIFTGQITGGTLKTKDKGDKESLQAKWCSMNDINMGKHGSVPLRGNDILPLIKMANDYRTESLSERHRHNLPVINAHRQLVLRLVIIHTEVHTGALFVLRRTDSNPHLPTCVISPSDPSIFTALNLVLQDAFGKCENLVRKVAGVLTVEHSGKPQYKNDGICLTLLVDLKTENEVFPSTTNDQYTCSRLENEDVIRDLSLRMNTKFNVKLVSLH